MSQLSMPDSDFDSMTLHFKTFSFHLLKYVPAIGINIFDL